MKDYLASRLQAFSLPPRIRDAGHSPWLPLALLLLALSTVFIFANDRDTFYRPGPQSPHNYRTANYLALAANMSPEHRFLGFYGRFLTRDGEISYRAYNRFPIGGFLLIKLSILPFPDDRSAQLYSARILMLLAYAGAALLAYLSLRRLTGHPWIALTAALLAFSSPYWLYFNDMVTTEASLDFFGVMLVFHAMVLFVQEGRFRQLLLKSCLALLLGWHTYALLLPFILLGLVSELIRARAAAPVASPLSRIRAAFDLLFRSRYLTLGVVTLLFGIAVLGFNFANEYFALNGQNGLTELGSFQSALSRSTLSGDFISDPLAWLAYLQQQLYRIGGMSSPYALPGYFNTMGTPPVDDLARHSIALGIAVTAVTLLGLAFVSHKILWATLSLFGLCWALLMYNNVAFQDFEALFLTGIPLTAFSLSLLYLSRPGGRRFIAAFAAAAILIFGLSAFRMAQIGHAETDSRFQQMVAADFQVILAETEGRTVAYRGKLPQLNAPVQSYLSGSLAAGLAVADFLILPLRLDAFATLTPQNSRLFLYPGGPDAFPNYLDHILAQAGPPLLNADYAVYHYAGHPYLPDDWLFYVKTPCQPQDRQARFLLHLIPQDPADLPIERWQYGFANLDFEFSHYAWSSRETCIAGHPLPTYPIARIRTGQFHYPDGHPLWQGEFAIPPAP